MMALIDKIDQEIKVAMKARDQLRLETLRSIKKELLEARAAKNAGGSIPEETEIKILTRMVKQRRDSAAIYLDQGRTDLGEREAAEAAIISGFLPEQLSGDQLEAKIRQIIAQTGATSLKDMGKVMGVATKQLAGKAEGKEISNLVKKLLG